MTQAEKRAAIMDVLAESPHLSDRQIGKQVGVDHKTVGAVRKSTVRAEEIAPTVQESLDSLEPSDSDLSQSSPNACRVCGGLKFWQDGGRGFWYCYACTPPHLGERPFQVVIWAA